MGCDIHFRVEKRVDGVWKHAEKMVPNKYWEPGDDEPEMEAEKLYSGRNYSLFSILANVRNGRGFAGCDTGDGFKPIAMPRGLPPDVSQPVKDDSERWGCDGHSHTWLTLAEVLAFDWTQTTKQRGWVNALEAEEWLRLKEWNIHPPSWCGSVGGGMVKHISMVEMEQLIKDVHAQYPIYRDFKQELENRYCHTYALAEWEIDYARCCKDFWVETIPALLRLGKPEDVRLVFWFDN